MGAEEEEEERAGKGQAGRESKVLLGTHSPASSLLVAQLPLLRPFISLPSSGLLGVL